MEERKMKNVFVDGAITPTYIGNSILNHNNKKNIGAHSIFLGQVRNDIVNDNEVTAIEYTAYEEMALEKFHEIREAIFNKYELICMHIYHSLGMVYTGEISLFVFVSSVHRKQAITACEEIVERIKKEVPVWGKEIFLDNRTQWKINT
jgi:molybdopterin synthase catalytic subunit